MRRANAFMIAMALAIAACSASSEPDDAAVAAATTPTVESPVEDAADETPQSDTTAAETAPVESAAPATTTPATSPAPASTVAPASTATPTTAATTTTEPGPVIVLDEERWALEDGVELVTTPNGARELVLDTEDRRYGASIDGLPTHNAVTVRFDLILVGPWDGGGTIGVVSGSSRVVVDTFSNTPGAPQSFPLGKERGETDALTGASEVDTLGFDQDAVFPVEHTFAHSGREIWFRFSATDYRVGAAFGVDNLEIELLRLPSSEIATEVDIAVEDGLITITGAVPTETDRDRFLDDLRRDLGDRLVSAELEIVGGVPAAWLGSTVGLTRALEGVETLTWQLRSNGGTVSGVVPEGLDESAFVRKLLSVGAVGFSLNTSGLTESD